MKKPLPELNSDEKLMLRCYLKKIIHDWRLVQSPP